MVPMGKQTVPLKDTMEFWKLVEAFWYNFLIISNVIKKNVYINLTMFTLFFVGAFLLANTFLAIYEKSHQNYVGKSQFREGGMLPPSGYMEWGLV